LLNVKKPSDAVSCKLQGKKEKELKRRTKRQRAGGQRNQQKKRDRK